MYYTYVIESLRDGRLYIGQTNNLEDRLHRHNTGQSRYTRGKGPWKYIYTKEFCSRSDAVRLERKLKAFKNKEYPLHWIAGQQSG